MFSFAVHERFIMICLFQRVEDKTFLEERCKELLKRAVEGELLLLDRI